MSALRPPDDDPLLAWSAAAEGRAELLAVATLATERARAAWAWFRPSPSFCELFAGIAESTPQEELPSLHWEDLALLDGFLQGQPQAALLMHQTVATRLVEVLRNRGASEEEADDLVQEHLCGLLDRTARSGAMAYSGRGTLIGWLKRSLLRDLARLRKSERRRSSFRPEAVAPPPWVDMESAVAAHQHRTHLRAVLREVFLAFEPESRRILRLVHSGGLSAQQVGVLIGLHRVTVQRRLGELRAELEKQTRKRLAERFGLDETTIRALVDATQHTFETTLSSVLATPNPA